MREAVEADLRWVAKTLRCDEREASYGAELKAERRLLPAREEIMLGTVTRPWGSGCPDWVLEFVLKGL